MIQRKCGTCKYFEEGGIASSGWCKHPERQDLEHMVLVRKTELACRNGWDDDLWEPREPGTSPQSGGARPRVRAGGSQGSASKGQNPTLPGHKGVSATLNGHSRSGSSEDPGQSPPASDHSGQRSNQALDAWSSSFEATLGGQRTDVDEVQGESISRRFMTGEDNSQGQREDIRSQEQSSGEADPRPPVFRGDLEGRASGESHPAEPIANHDDGEPAPETRTVQQSGLTEPFEVEPSEDHPSNTFGISEVDHHSEGLPDSDDPEQYSDAADQSRLPMAGQENACCRNCRDFLPSKASNNGWCNNPYAFGKRTEVSGDTVACQSTFGSWWSPSDDWWMERADIAHHSAPTPLVDTMIRQIRDRELDERGSTNAPDRS